MKPGAALITLALLLASPASAQTPADPTEAAREASLRLSRAADALSEATGAQNRIRALAEVITAFEQGLEAMRAGLRGVAGREQALSAELRAREDEVARLLGVLQRIGQTSGPLVLLHPTGALDTARAGMILSEVAPALDMRAEDLRRDLQELTDLRRLQQSAINTMQRGLEGIQQARTSLSEAMAERTDLPRRFTEDPVRTALLIASTETLAAFADGLSEIAVNEAPGSLPDISGRKGDLPMPAEGLILRRAGEVDAAGITRPGIVLATRPRALVTTPAAATVRYRGPLLDYGNVIILEPQSGILLVFAGLDVVYGQAGEVLPGGSPVGLMGGSDGDLLITADAQDTGAQRTETLYIEVRQDNSPVDPLAWFKTDKEE
ncbi:Septal ring factor EnvC, activator of murein hydrolases AmiA and AmiB [Roseovarius azorensis]|uniref:Septal ring factor EnvC, activator of murein hydrolases AmiA and AmiB n=1 Tax=Roseovarius azorensis TaxID=1287727 RepID=A0A1H7H448_9RHOB|nr:peptidoglycan DD-metalloendopeptidase family protein [Roseovarius azorensis]SEK42895.1 Septal ring factor EnvC, activator of murein hydrolases AmiA and AmiB [Roseovarius azorensis]